MYILHCTLQVDGVEMLTQGIDLFEFADILIDNGCWEAVVRANHMCKSIT